MTHSTQKGWSQYSRSKKTRLTSAFWVTAHIRSDCVWVRLKHSDGGLHSSSLFSGQITCSPHTSNCFFKCFSGLGRDLRSMSPKPLREFILIQEKIRSDRETSKKPCIYEGDIVKDQSIKDHLSVWVHPWRTHLQKDPSFTKTVIHIQEYNPHWSLMQNRKSNNWRERERKRERALTFGLPNSFFVNLRDEGATIPLASSSQKNGESHSRMEKPQRNGTKRPPNLICPKHS